MAYSKAGMRAVEKYVKENYSRLNIKIPKAQKAAVEAHAQRKGECQRPCQRASAGRHGAVRDGMEEGRGGGSIREFPLTFDNSCVIILTYGGRRDARDNEGRLPDLG